MTQRTQHPKAVAGCPACEASVSTVCIQHAGGQVPADDDERRCAGFSKSGSRCRKWRIAGEEFCLAHQTNEAARQIAIKAPGQARSERRKLEKTAREHLDAIGVETGVDLDALEALADLSDEAIALKDFFRTEMKKRVVDEAAPGEIDQFINRYTSALDRAAKLVEGYGKHGLEKRIVEIREELSALVTAVFNQLLTFIPEENQPLAIISLQRTVAAIEQPKALTA